MVSAWDIISYKPCQHLGRHPRPKEASTLLTERQARALDHVGKRARRDESQAVLRVHDALGVEWPLALTRSRAEAVVRAALVTLNFHPDRVLADGRTVAQALAQDGVYRNQFETGVFAGGLTGYPGGDRDRW